MAIPSTAKAKQKVAERLKEWHKNGWSKPAVPGNHNNNPLLAVNKKSVGVVAFDNIRLCIDARQLNTLNRTKKRTYMLPRIADILKKAQKATFMADLDLKAAFHQFLLDARSSELSTFTSLCDSSRQQMTRMWFGKEGVSDHCQMIVERVMGLREDGTEDWDLFVDNLYMFFTGSDIRKFAESVARLIRKFTEAGLKLNRKKCKIGYVRMQVLGFLCEKGQCSVDLNKLECFKKMKKLKGQQELPAGFHEFPARPNPAVQPSSGTPATNCIQEELGQRHVGPRARTSVQQIENSFIESASSTPTRHGQSFPHINGRIAARGRSGPLPSGKRGEEVCIVHVESVEERATKLLSNKERAPSNCLHTKEMGTFLDRDEIQCRNRPQSTIIST